ncbi:L-lysine 6-monooxygenase (NADPH) [Shewanella baltica OS195]|uniref:L-lysine 6-monooxygenase (NADPH) n=1 Tax=Shewanella baltica (strain OS195) TaxID=399599 RepID=A9KTS1_SHEB9|nr:SidA/IucD/PvdA family monooxygenase [Shewanella baltica]ABX49976.1 L-lysine 6-monooxygenase (NADPH) [Shewanella baltica OS195]ADT94966.1 L-lysine 6-monooxygenase (NADPH) [Shewanella baltica OS678]
MTTQQREMDREIFDLLGIGIGPFNLGLAALSEPIDGFNCLFLDAKTSFDWHPGMLLKSSRLQTPFMSDLVTMADPTSRYSYLNFAKKTGRLYPFYIRENFFLPRHEYNLYCQWVSQQLSNLKFGFKVTQVDYNAGESIYRVTGFDRRSGKTHTYQCRKLVLGTGTEPYLPKDCPIQDARVMHTASYMQQKTYLQSQSAITVIGSGQSAAEVFYDLLQDIDTYGYQLNWMTRSARFYPLEYTKLTLEMTSPDYVDYFHELTPEKRCALIASQKSLYKGINAELINDIYDLLYQKRLIADFQCQLMTNVALTRIQTDPDTLKLHFQHQEQDAPLSQTTGAVVLGTGYHYRLPQFIKDIKQQIEFDDAGQLAVQRDYSIDIRGDIFVQNVGLHTHGVSSPDLGMGCYRNGIILKAVLGYAPYHIEEHIAFQTFDPAKLANHQPCGANAINTLNLNPKHFPKTSPHSNNADASPHLYPTQTPTSSMSAGAGTKMSVLMAPNKEAQ